MSSKVKLVLITAAVVGLVLVTLAQYRKLQQQVSLSEGKVQHANLALGRAQTQLADARKQISQLTDDLQKEIRDRKAIVTAYGELLGLYEAEQRRVKTITKVIYRDKHSDVTVDVDKEKLFFLGRDSKYYPVTSLTYRYSDFRIDIDGDAVKETISYRLHQKFAGQLVETKLPSGAYNHYFKLWELDGNDKPVGQLKLTKFEVIRGQDDPPLFRWWNPKLDLALAAGARTNAEFHWDGTLGVSLASYGNKEILSWRFIRLGLGLASHNGLALTATPAAFNLGSVLPLISNLWLEGHVAYDLIHQVPAIAFGLSVVF